MAQVYKTPDQQLFEYSWTEYDKYRDYQDKHEYQLMYKAYKSCEQAFLHAKKLGEAWIKAYVYDPLALVCKRIIKVIKKVVNYAKGALYSLTDDIDWNRWKSFDGEQCYLIQMLDENHNFMWLKVGTTSRDTSARLHEHLNHTYKGGTVKALKVLAIWDCIGISAVAIEDLIRKYYIEHFGENYYIKNDRFAIIDDGIELIPKVQAVINQLKEIRII